MFRTMTNVQSCICLYSPFALLAPLSFAKYNTSPSEPIKKGRRNPADNTHPRNKNPNTQVKLFIKANTTPTHKEKYKPPHSPLSLFTSLANQFTRQLLQTIGSLWLSSTMGNQRERDREGGRERGWSEIGKDSEHRLQPSWPHPFSLFK